MVSYEIAKLNGSDESGERRWGRFLKKTLNIELKNKYFS